MAAKQAASELAHDAPGMDDEQRPLLANVDSGTTAQDDDRPLPVKQIMLLALARLIDPVSYFAIFPFVNQMVFDTGSVKESDVGFYTGLIESLFSLVQMCCMVFWARISDRYGRKTALLMGMTGLTIASTAFGFSRTVWQMLFFRAVAGAFSGNVLIVRTMVAEQCTPKTQARAFSYFSGAYSIGILLGPVFGGIGATPTTEYPSLFGGIRLFEVFPYALATLMVGALGLILITISALFVDETLPVEMRTGKPAAVKARLTNRELFATPGVKLVIWVFSHVMLIAFAFTALFPVIAFTPVSLGGFAFRPRYISYFLFTAAITQGVVMVAIFPALQRRFGTINIMRLCALNWVFAFLGPPACNLLLRGGHTTMFWILLCFVNIQTSASSMTFVAIQLMLNDICPSPTATSMLNAVAISIVSGIRAFAPAVITSLFAVGVREQILKGHFVWLLCSALALGLVAVCMVLPKQVDGRVYEKGRGEEVGKSGGHGDGGGQEGGGEQGERE